MDGGGGWGGGVGGFLMEAYTTHITSSSPSPYFTSLIVHAGYMQPLSKSQLSVAGDVASLCETSSPFQCQPVRPTLWTTAGEAELTKCI